MAEKLEAHVEVRTQRAPGKGWASGPDTYVAVQVVPEGQDRLEVLNHKSAAKRGIEIIRCGEGYAKRSGPRSSLGIAMSNAIAIAERINSQHH